MEKYKIISGLIKDAEYKDDVTDSDFTCGIDLLIEDQDSGNIFAGHFSSADVRDLIRCPRELTTRELIKFAASLRERTTPITVRVYSQENIFNAQTLEDLDDIIEEEEIPKPSRTALVTREE